jgi:UDP-N-acetylglucosamine 2-epimerase (non-hydrolysing)
VSSKIAVVVGTRPEVIKLAPVVEAIRRTEGLEALLVSTGQHRQMLDQALEAFGLEPDIDLRLMSPIQSLHEVTSRAVSGMREVLDDYRPDRVVVQGNTTTAFAAALAAFYSRVPVAHVEAGLRSGDRHAPFPEEINRRMVDHVADLLFAPTEDAGAVLRAEGFDPGSVHVTGNTVVDALLLVAERLQHHPVAVRGLPEQKLAGKRLLLVTAHGRESFGEAFCEMCVALRRIVADAPDVVVVYPMRLDACANGPARVLLGDHERIVLLEPVDYAQFVALLQRAHLVLTDSGGVQEEAPTFAKPLLVLRDETEWPEGIAAGVASLVGTDADRIYDDTMRLLEDEVAYESMASGINPYGDGHAAERIVAVLAGSIAGGRRLRRTA